MALDQKNPEQKIGSPNIEAGTEKVLPEIEQAPNEIEKPYVTDESPDRILEPMDKSVGTELRDKVTKKIEDAEQSPVSRKDLSLELSKLIEKTPIEESNDSIEIQELFRKVTNNIIGAGDGKEKSPEDVQTEIKEFAGLVSKREDGTTDNGTLGFVIENLNKLIRPKISSQSKEY